MRSQLLHTTSAVALENQFGPQCCPQPASTCLAQADRGCLIKHPVFRTLAGIAFLLFLGFSGRASADGSGAILQVIVEQITFESAHTGFVPDSEYAHLTITYPPAPARLQRFLNMYLDIGTGPGWVVQNMPLLDELIVGPGNRSPSTMIDLSIIGLTRGTSLLGQPFIYSYSLSDDPVGAPPPFQPKGSGMIGRRVYDQGGANVYPPGEFGLNAAVKGPLKPPYDGGINKEFSWRTNLDSHNRNVGHNQCGPAAITVSLTWLAEEYPDAINLGIQTWYQTLQKVKNNIPNYVDGVGVWDDEIIRGKLGFFQRPDKQIADGWQVKYQGGVGNKNAMGVPSSLPQWVQEGGLVARKMGEIPDFGFLKSQLADGEDVELTVDYLYRHPTAMCMTNADCPAGYFCSDGSCYKFTGAHVMAVRGFLTHGNKTFLWTTDDGDQDPLGHKPGDLVPFSDDGLRDEHLQQVIVGGPGDGPLNGYMYLGGEAGLNRVRFVVAESPPEPTKPVVFDTVYSSIPGTTFGPGIWTKDGIPIGKTFATGVTPPPGVLQNDRAVLPEEPNDWHWTVTFTLGMVDHVLDVDLSGFSLATELNVDVISCTSEPSIKLVADIALDTYELRDENDLTFHAGSWSGYPGNVPPQCSITGSWREGGQPTGSRQLAESLSLCEDGACTSAVCGLDISNPPKLNRFLQDTVAMDHVYQNDIQLAILQGPQFCREDADCTVAGEICDTVEKACRLQCAGDAGCPAGQRCAAANVNGKRFCADFCNADWTPNPNPPPDDLCPAGMTCCPDHDQTCDMGTNACSGAKDKINGFQRQLREILAKSTIPANKIKGVTNFQQAIAAINADAAAKGHPISVHIFGHGREGSIKVGEDRLNLDTPAGQAAVAKFLQNAPTGVQGNVSRLVLVGCKTGGGAEGQKLLETLSGGLRTSQTGIVPTKAWTGTVFAYSAGVTQNDKLRTDGNKVEKTVPTINSRIATWPRDPDKSFTIYSYKYTNSTSGQEFEVIDPNNPIKVPSGDGAVVRQFKIPFGADDLHMEYAWENVPEPVTHSIFIPQKKGTFEWEFYCFKQPPTEGHTVCAVNNSPPVCCPDSAFTNCDTCTQPVDCNTADCIVPGASDAEEPVGQCCEGNVCVADDIDEDTCLALNPTNIWTPGKTCNDPCSCTDDAQCDDGQFCTGLETCDDATGQCVPGTPPVCPGTTSCSNSVCDPTVNGGSGGCVVLNKAAGTACGSAAETACDNPDICDGSGNCLSNNEPAGTVCRPMAGTCDAAESCDGNGNCPADGFASGGVCRPAVGDCDVAESCDGSGPNCPPNGFASGGECRPSTDGCDPAEFCNGLGPDCPPDVRITECQDGDACCPEGCTDAEDLECPSSTIPTVGEWGLVTLALLLLIAGRVYFGGRSPASA